MYFRSEPAVSSATMTLSFVFEAVVLITTLLAQGVPAPSDPTRAIVGRLQLEQYKSHIKGLAQFGDRMQGTDRNRAAIDWLEKQLRSFGYTNVVRHRFM